MFKKLIFIGMSAALVACGGGNSSSDSADDASNNTAKNDLQLPDVSAGDNCRLINVEMTPPSGATLRRSRGDELVVTVDFEVLSPVKRLFLYAEFRSLDGNDGGYNKFDDDIKQYNVQPGRIIDDIRIRVTEFDNDRYTALRIRGYAGTRGCNVLIPVDYIVTD